MISNFRVRHLTLMLWSRVATNIGAQAWSHNRLHYNCSGQGGSSRACSSWLFRTHRLRDRSSQAGPCESWWRFVCLSESGGNESDKKQPSLWETGLANPLRCMMVIMRPMTLMIRMTGLFVTIMTRCHVMNISAPSSSPHSDTAWPRIMSFSGWHFLSPPLLASHIQCPGSRSNPLSSEGVREGET